MILVLMAALLTFNVGAGNPAVATPLMSSLVLTAPTLGNYGNTPVSLSADATVTPDAAPTNVTSINVTTSTNFKGTFVASSTTGVVRVTNAHPAGTYPVTVRASGDGGLEVTRTFTLTVQVGTACTGVPAFTHSADVAIGPSSREVAIGDFNNDGKQDLAVANGLSTGIVSIRLGDGVGGFSGTTSISVGTFPFSVAIGDFNNDGKQDIATANSGSDTASIRLGDGLGGFSGTTEVSVGSGPRSIAVGDLNNDGKPDFATANESANTASIRLGDGVGGFTGNTEVSVGSQPPDISTQPASIALGDFNNDGNRDIAVANFLGTVSIRFGNGAGGFTGTTEIGVAQPLSVVIGDFTNDGKQDLAAAGPNGVSIRLGDGAGGFSGTTQVSGLTSAAIGDFNNDGKQDLAGSSANGISVRLGDGTGGFGAGIQASPVNGPLAIGDFNQDAKQDIAAAASNIVSIHLGSCNTAPTIAAIGLSRQQGSPASNSQIATVTDNGGNGNVTVTVTGANPSNGVTISNIVNTGGNITANVAANCAASNATFTLQASDGSLTATDNLSVTVTPNSGPTLTYSGPQSVPLNGSLSVTPAAASDNGQVTYSVQTGHGLTTPPTVNESGVVSITNAGPVGSHSITIRATDNCGAISDAVFALNVSLTAMISFSLSNSNVSEIIDAVTITVIRTGNLSIPVTVDYATDDTGSPNGCDQKNGLASARCDFGLVLGNLKFAATETQKTFVIPITQDAYTEGPEMFTVTLSNVTGSNAVLATPSTTTVTINDSASPTPNAIDDTTIFVRQQYRDFLNREADAAGLAFWKDNIDKCNDPARRPAGQTVAQCIEVQRITTSAAFFLSIEFRQTGGLVRDFYVASLDRPLTNNMPNLVEFMRDTQAIQKGVVVGQGDWQQVLDANRLVFMNEFVTRAEFVGLYPTTDTPTQYVDKLYQHAAVSPASPGERAAAVAEFGAAATAADAAARARALLRVTQNPTFQARELPRSFVHMEYLGYLRRNPNDPPDNNFDGFNFWVNKLIQFNGDFLQAEMVKAFLNSLEYRKRFGP